MKNIQSISIWINGEIKTAELINVFSQYDDLASRAVFHYDLITIDNFICSSGNIDINGEECLLWGFANDINLTAYEYVAGKLNLVLA